MKKKFLSFIFLFPMNHFGMEMPSLEFKNEPVPKPVEVIQPSFLQQAASMAQNMTMQQFIRNAILVTSTLKNPLGAAASYSATKGLAAAHPLMQKYVATALQGRLQELKNIASELREKIQNSWLPMQKERSQLAALEEVINSEVAHQLQVMKYGTYEQVQCAVHHIVTSLQIHQNSNFESAPSFTKEVLDQCREVLTTNLHHVPVSLMDNVITSPSTSPTYFRKEISEKISQLDIEKLGVEKFFKQSVKILNESKSLTQLQKKAFLVEFLHDMFEKNLVGRLSKTFGEQLYINLKAHQFFKAGKFLCDWAFGYIYLTDTELEEHVQKWLDGYETISTMCTDIKNGNEARMHELMKASADILSSFPHTHLKKIKMVTTKSAGIVQALERLH